MPPPPIQKGKFKPRRQAKKVKSPAAAPSESPIANTPTVAFAPSTKEISSDGRSAGRVSRSRAPVPSGEVFFTGVENSESAGNETKAKTSRAIQSNEVKRTTSPQKQEPEDTEEEEVVGQLETAIGSSKTNSKKATSPKPNAVEPTLQSNDSDADVTLSNDIGCVDGILYDSDSSGEDEKEEETSNRTSLLPLELPFSSSYSPAGPAISAPGFASHDTDASEASPFAASIQPEGITWEKDGWFLVQLPTRLPPLKTEVLPDAVESDMAVDTPASERQISSLFHAEVATPTIAPNSHDNTLCKAAPGRIGKLLVYKSGKTVLEMEAADGSRLRLNVHEGLSCGFLQQAAVIDTAEGKFVSLGEVKKTVVMSPDLGSAFSSN